jgi:hypothetical protein
VPLKPFLSASHSKKKDTKLRLVVTARSVFVVFELRRGEQVTPTELKINFVFLPPETCFNYEHYRQ